MRSISPRATAQLAHDGYLLRPCAAGVAVAGPASAVTLLGPTLARRGALVATGAIEDVAWSASGRLAVIIDDDGLRAIEPSQRTLRWRVVGKSYACHLSADDEVLWVARPAVHGAAPGQGPGAWIELRDAGNGAVLARRYIEDPFGGSAFTLAPHPEPRGILVWLAAPDGKSQTVAVLARGRELAAAALPFRDGYPPEPLLTPRPGAYLLARPDRVERRRWADHAVEAELAWSVPDDAPLAVLPVGPRLALWASQAGRLHLVDHTAMTCLEELAIAGYEPRQLEDPQEAILRWGTELAQLCIAGGHVICQFGERDLVSLAADDFTQ